MKIEIIIKTKITLILLLPIWVIFTAWEQITFSSLKELVFLSPLMLLYGLSSNLLKNLADDSPSLSYYKCEFLSLLLVVCLNIMLIIKLYSHMISN